MPITSTNHNPNNDSLYARHRSIFKGKTNQLRRTVAALKATQGVRVYEYDDTPGMVNKKFEADWGISLEAYRVAPGSMQVLGTWVMKPPSARLLRAAGSMNSDLKLVWYDFMLCAGRRIGASSGAGYDPDVLARYAGKSLVVFAVGSQSLDIILSKYGYGDALKHNHHFYHWQARAGNFDGMVNVDDYEKETV